MKKLFDNYDFPPIEYENVDFSNIDTIKDDINQKFYTLERSLLEGKTDNLLNELTHLGSFILYLPYTELGFVHKYYFQCVLDGCRHWLFVLNMSPSERLAMKQTYLRSFGVRS